MTPMNLTNTARAFAARRGVGRNSGAALLITLLVLTLMVIIVVAFLGTMSWEMQSSQREYEGQKARAIATYGLHTAVAQLRTASATGIRPYGNIAGAPNFFTNPPTFYYSISPGILTRWSYTSVNATTNMPLFSVPTDGNTNTANLNAPAQDGVYPILGTSTALPAYWVDVLANPKIATGSANPIVGRFAFWVDDENSKINVNTADGRFNNNSPPQQCGLGWGTPTAVSLNELQSEGAPLSDSTVGNIVALPVPTVSPLPGKFCGCRGRRSIPTPTTSST